MAALAVLGIPITISTLSTVVKVLSKGGSIAYSSYGVTKAGLNTVKSKPSRYLLERCSAIAELLQKIEYAVLATNLGLKLVETLVEAVVWSYEYDKKYKLTKILLSSSHNRKFQEYHDAISQDYCDITNSVIIFAISNYRHKRRRQSNKKKNN